MEGRPGRFSANVPESAPGNRDATGIDLAIKPYIASILEFTKEVDGIRICDEPLLLVDKIQCFGTRSSGHRKLKTDLEDIFFCIMQLDGHQQTIPSRLQEIFLEKFSWDRFWPRLLEHSDDDSDVLFYQSQFAQLGLIECVYI